MDRFKIPEIKNQAQLREYVTKTVALANDLPYNRITDETPLGDAAREIGSILAYTLDMMVIVAEDTTVGHLIEKATPYVLKKTRPFT